MATTLLEQILKEGAAKGKAEGMAEGKIQSLLTILELRFGEIPAALHKKLMKLRDTDRLEQIIKLAVTCKSIREFQKAL